MKSSKPLASAILPRVNGPQDIRDLSIEQLEQLAGEVRERIIQVISRIGGHFGASMGSVDLTIALHHVLDTPTDKIIWDVGHQTYAHKILTGRNDSFESIRQMGGLSGFPRRDESEYDVFAVGHASTSISAALGVAKARDIKGEKFRVCAVIGDGSMTGGLAFEGMNNVGSLGADMLVILNDNEMSISPNVGAMSRYFNRIITDHFYNQAKGDIEHMIQRIPAIGKRLLDLTHQVEAGAKEVILPGRLFENLGIRYIGPIDGHDLGMLARTLDRIKDYTGGPILLHVITRKGKGYEQSEKDPARWHAPGLFEPVTGEIAATSPGPPSYTDVFGEALSREADRDKRIVAITAAMTPGVGLENFADKYPDRFFDVGIAEGHAVVFSAALATEGLIPVCCIYSTFMQRAYDNVIHDVALQDLHVVFCLDRGGLVGEDGPTHHGVYDLSFLRTVPGLVIMGPKDEAELCDMVHTALEVCKGPVAIRYPRGRGQGVKIPENPNALEVGKAEVISEGKDVTLLAIGKMVSIAEEAAEILACDGLDVGVINMRFAKPIDAAAIRAAAENSRALFSLEDNSVVGGLGSAINETLAGLGLSANCHPFGIPDEFIQHGSLPDLMGVLELIPEAISKRVKERVSPS